ncbi:MAG: translation elongation factor Ts [Candidatus Paceibacterota bacterium]|jgi:elongation factor Ts|nr:translation elongation factor Ts [Candidatus Paceibacterota bacterium]
MADMEQIKKLREETGVSITECKKALEQVQGDLDEAKKVLRERGIELAGKRAEKETAQGIVESYIHPNKKVGVLLELRCESDFVARSEDFQNLAHEICMQIAAMKPIFVSEDQIPEEFLDGEKKIYQEQVADSGKPQNIVEQIIEGKLSKYKESVSLMSQPWIKDQDKTISDLLNETIAKIGEKIVVKNFTRYEI